MKKSWIYQILSISVVLLRQLGKCILVKIRQKVTGTITLDSYTIIGQKIYKIGIKFD